MKKIFIIISSFIFIAICVFIVNLSEKTTTTSTNLTSGFALIKNSNSYLYKIALESDYIDNKYFLLEKSYYVKVLENTNDTFYKVEYQSVIGYAKKNEIEFVEEIPENPYPLSITFDIYSGGGVSLFIEPTTKNGISSILLTILAGQKNLVYLGKITGEEVSNGLSNIWYYCEYSTSENQKICGYIYSAYATNLSPIIENNEKLTITTVSNYVPLESLLYLNLSTKNLILLCISVPTIIILYLFIKP